MQSPKLSLRAGANTKAVEEADTALRINPNFTAALITRSLAQSDLKLYSEAAASLEQLLAASPDDMDAESWRGQMEELRHRIYLESNPGPLIFTGKEVTQKARVLSKPEPAVFGGSAKGGSHGNGCVARSIHCRGRSETHSDCQSTGLRTHFAIDQGCSPNTVHSRSEGRPTRLDVHSARIQFQSVLRLGSFSK